MLEDKINKYYNQLLEYSYKYCHDRYVIDYKHSIKYVLKELIEKNGLDMKLIDSSYNFERTQLYFTYLSNKSEWHPVANNNNISSLFFIL